MTGVKKPEDLTLDEVREQIALYQRLYYKLRMQDPDYAAATRERKGLRKQRMKEARGEKIKSVPNRRYSMDNMAVIKPNKVEAFSSDHVCLNAEDFPQWWKVLNPL